MLKFLPIRDVSSFTRTGKEWREDEQLWKMLMERDFQKSGTKLQYREEEIMKRAQSLAKEVEKIAWEVGNLFRTNITKEKGWIFIWKVILTEYDDNSDHFVFIKIDPNGYIYAPTGKVKRGNVFGKLHGLETISIRGVVLSSPNQIELRRRELENGIFN